MGCPLQHCNNITEGWISFIEQLRFMLERPPNAPRKAVFMSTTLIREHLLDELNLKDVKEGAQFEGRFQSIGLSGEVRYATKNQLGLIIRGWGPGLLIIQFNEGGYISTMY